MAFEIKLSEEHQILQKTLKSFVKKEVEPQALAQDRKEKFNTTLFKKLGPLGLLGLTIDTKYGGSGLDAKALVIAHEELSFSDPGFTLAYLAHAVLCTHNIFTNANEEQKKRWLPKLCSGEWVGAMAMSEAGAGTDVFGMKTNFTKTKNHFQLTGRKMWITNGFVDDPLLPADCLLVYAQGQKKEISTFVVEKNSPGCSVGQIIKDKTGMRASNTCELVFDSCKIPQENLIGGEGKSLKQMMKNLEIERLTLASISLGIAKRCLKEMNKYASERKAFNKPLREFGQIQKYLAKSYAEYKACKLYIYHTADSLSKNTNQRLDTDSVKLITAKTAKNIADRAIQVLGAYGYVGEYTVERLWRDAKLLEIGGGTNEALEKNISKELTHKEIL